MTTKSVRIDALRGCAILAVVQYHYGSGFGLYAWLDAPALVQKALGYGWAGVDLFFVLSGFLLTRNLLRTRGDAGALRTFYLRRLFRIWPLYSLVLAAATALWWFWRPDAGGPGGWLLTGLAPSWTYAIFLQNFWTGLQPEWTGHFLSPTWSLAVEEHFYLVLPLIVLFLPARYVFGLSVSLIIGAFFVRIGVYAGFGDLATVAWTIARLDSLGWGMMAALAAQGGASALQRFRLAWTSAAIALLIALACVALAENAALPGSAAIGAATLYSVTALIAARAVAATAGADNVAAAWRSASLKPLAWAGSRCYSLYLLHMPVAGLIALAFGRATPVVDNATGAAVLISAVVALLVIAELSYRMIEQPFIAFGERVGSIGRSSSARTAAAV